MASCNTANSPLLEHDTAITAHTAVRGPWLRIERKDEEHEHVQGNVDPAHNQVQRVVDCNLLQASQSIRSGWRIPHLHLSLCECCLAPRCLPTMASGSCPRGATMYPWKHHVPLTQPIEHHRPQAELIHHLVGRIRARVGHSCYPGPARELVS